MGTVSEYITLSHEIDELFWLVQGDKADEWFTARTWQQNLLTVFYKSNEAFGTFNHEGSPYYIQYVQFGPENTMSNRKEIVIKNLKTGMVRLVKRCNVTVYSHLGSRPNYVALLQKDNSYDMSSTVTEHRVNVCDGVCRSRHRCHTPDKAVTATPRNDGGATAYGFDLSISEKIAFQRKEMYADFWEWTKTARGPWDSQADAMDDYKQIDPKGYVRTIKDLVASQCT